MANIKYSRKEFEKSIKLSDDVMEKISLFGTHLEEISDDEIEVEVCPNRPDLLSLQGFLRGFKQFIGMDVSDYKLDKFRKDFRVLIDDSVKNVRPYTACAIVKGLSLSDERIKEIIELQEKLHYTLGRNRKKLAIGIYPLEKIKLPISYKALKPKDIKFVPLEESKEMNGLQVLQRTKTGRDYGKLLEGHDLFPVFLDGNGEVLSMPPIINSDKTGRVDINTRDVFVECSGFEFEFLNKALSIITTSLADMGGSIYPMELSYGKDKKVTPNLEYSSLSISLENVNKLLGLSLNEKNLSDLLNKMGHKYDNGKVYSPPWRVDIFHEVDLIEDVAIAYGYDKFIPEIPPISTIGEADPRDKLKRKIARILIGLGFLEISSYHLIRAEEAKIMRYKDIIEVEESKTDYKFLRPSLLVSSLRVFSENKDEEYPQRVFELGRVFSKIHTDEGNSVNETDSLVIACSPGHFTESKQILNYLFESLGISYASSEGDVEGLIDGRVADISVNGKRIGFIGEVHPDRLRSWGMKMPVSVIEISLEEIFDILI